MTRIQFNPGAVGMARQGKVISLRRKVEPLVEVTLFYSYATPGVSVAPASGEIVHGGNTLNKLIVSHTDLNGVDVSASIGQITTGDFVSISETIYDVVAPTVADTGFSYITVSPETQKQPGIYPVKAWR